MIGVGGGELHDMCALLCVGSVYGLCVNMYACIMRFLHNRMRKKTSDNKRTDPLILFAMTHTSAERTVGSYAKTAGFLLPGEPFFNGGDANKPAPASLVLI